jgi:hypothetical protein
VSPSALECAKLGVYQAMTEQGIKKAELAQRLGWHMSQVDRLFDLRHASKMGQLEAAINALGKKIEVRIAQTLYCFYICDFFLINQSSLTPLNLTPLNYGICRKELT